MEKENLKIELEEGTTILNIAYKDGNKEIILPVLKNYQKDIRNLIRERKTKK